MVTIKKDGFICELFLKDDATTRWIIVNVYERRWLFFKTFMWCESFEWNDETKLKEYARLAIERVRFLYN